MLNSNVAPVEVQDAKAVALLDMYQEGVRVQVFINLLSSEVDDDFLYSA
jgi:hypothetical protein